MTEHKDTAPIITNVTRSANVAGNKSPAFGRMTGVRRCASFNREYHEWLVIMTMNPRDYDLDELRKMARKQGGDNGTRDADFDPEELDVSIGDDEVTAGSSYRAGLYRELLPFLGSDGFEKPYLRTLPETYAAEYVVFEWLEFLLMHSGYQGASDALDYYESIDWLAEDAQSDLEEYLRGIDESTAGDSDLDVDDHLLSLLYVAKLHAME